MQKQQIPNLYFANLEKMTKNRYTVFNLIEPDQLLFFWPEEVHGVGPLGPALQLLPDGERRGQAEGADPDERHHRQDHPDAGRWLVRVHDQLKWIRLWGQGLESRNVLIVSLSSSQKLLTIWNYLTSLFNLILRNKSCILLFIQCKPEFPTNKLSYFYS